jgi:hypothetical protein
MGRVFELSLHICWFLNRIYAYMIVKGYFLKNLNPRFTQEFFLITTHPNLITDHL